MTNIIIDNGRLANSFHQRAINIFHKYSLDNFSDFSDKAITDFDNMVLRCLNVSIPYKINLYGLIELQREGNTILCVPTTPYLKIGRRALAKSHYNIDSDYRIFTESRDLVCNHSYSEVQKFLEVVEEVEKYQETLRDDVFVFNNYHSRNVNKGDFITLNVYDLDLEKNIQISGRVDIGNDFEWDDGSDRGPYSKSYNLNKPHITFYSIHNSNSSYYWYINSDSDDYYYYTIDEPFLHNTYDDIINRGISIIIRSRQLKKVEEAYNSLMRLSGYWGNKPTYITPLTNMYMFKEFDNHLSELTDSQIQEFSHYANKHICFFVRFPYLSPQLQ